MNLKLLKIVRFFHLINKKNYNEKRQIEIVKKSPLFDAKWYLAQNPDVKAKKIGAAKHYVKYGWKEGRNPSDKFSTKKYLDNNIDVKKADINPLVHYEIYGIQEGRFVYSDVQANSRIIIPQKYKNKIGVIYTCITGKYDNLVQHHCVNNNFDYVCFTDNQNLLIQKNVKGWIIKPLKYNKMDDIRNARWHKVHPEELFPEYDYSIWIDGNLDVLNDNLFKHFNKFKRKHEMIFTYKHPLRNCIYDEAESCLFLKKDYPETIHKQVEFLRSELYPKHNGLDETGIVIRKHNDEKYRKVAETWWQMISEFSRRDQLSFRYALWKNKVQIIQTTDILSPTYGIGKISHEGKKGKITQFVPVKTLSIIIPVYNALDEVKNLFTSILAANLTENTEILVINDASKQETTSFLQEFIKKYPQFKLFENEKNLGFVRSCNRGMEIASGDIVVLLNSDTIIPKSFEKKVIYFFNKKKNAGLASPISSDTGLWKIPFPKELTVNDMDKLVEHLSKKEFPEMLCPEGFCICIRKQVLQDVGYLDEIYGRGYCEETDLGLRALNNGWELRLIDNLFVVHKHHVSFGSKLRDEQIAKNSKILWSRWRQLYDKYERKFKTNVMVQNKTKQILQHISVAKSDENSNSTIIGHNVNVDIDIQGRKNKIVIKSAQNESKLKISINGNGNIIYIDNSIKIDRLRLAIGTAGICKINNARIHIGKNFSCGASQILVYNDDSSIKIGDDNLWSWNIILRSGELPHLLFDYKTGKRLNKPGNVIIGDHVWIGQNVGIMSKAQIPHDCVVGAFSVVTHQFHKQHTLIAGNPAAIKKKNIHFERNLSSITNMKFKTENEENWIKKIYSILKL